MDIGGKLSESIFAASSNCDVLIINSVAIALVSPVDGNPLIILSYVNYICHCYNWNKLVIITLFQF